MELKDKILVCTGAAGYLGVALLKRLSTMECKEIRCFDHNEEKAVLVKKQFPKTKWIIGDIRDSFKIFELVNGADIVIHCAAQKHIPVAEEQPSLAVDSNILGSSNVAIQSINAKVPVVLGISTDKAYCPATIYGISKYIMERLFQEYNEQNLGTKFLTVRYPNVIASSGSVFELWDKLGKEGKTLEITEPEMTRFYFTVEDALDVIFKGLELQLDKPYIPTVKSIRMQDALDIFCEHYKVDSRMIGNRGNEKIAEELDDKQNSATCERYTKDEFKNILIGCGLLK